jgi:2,3-bisphosphoglycerate-dependent phosphoglycerate mutase
LERHGNTQDRVAVVSHGGFYNHFLAVVLGLEARGKWWFLLNNTAITRIDFTLEEARLVYQNRVEHLPRELIT